MAAKLSYQSQSKLSTVNWGRLAKTICCFDKNLINFRRNFFYLFKCKNMKINQSQNLRLIAIKLLQNRNECYNIRSIADQILVCKQNLTCTIVIILSKMLHKSMCLLILVIFLKAFKAAEIGYCNPKLCPSNKKHIACEHNMVGEEISTI